MTTRERDVIRGFLGEAHQEMLIDNASYVALLDRLDEEPIAELRSWIIHHNPFDDKRLFPH